MRNNYISAIYFKVGIGCFGGKEEHTVSSDLTQLHDTEMFSPLDTSKLSRNYKAEALAYLIFLT